MSDSLSSSPQESISDMTPLLEAGRTPSTSTTHGTTTPDSTFESDPDENGGFPDNSLIMPREQTLKKGEKLGIIGLMALTFYSVAGGGSYGLEDAIRVGYVPMWFSPTR